MREYLSTFKIAVLLLQFGGGETSHDGQERSAF